MAQIEQLELPTLILDMEVMEPAPVQDKHYEMRCQNNLFNLDSNRTYRDIINEQFHCSKLIWNQGLYCNRTWFSRIMKIIMNAMLENLSNIIDTLTIQDKLSLFSHAYFNKNWEATDLIILNVTGDDLNKLIELIFNFDAKYPVELDSSRECRGYLDMFASLQYEEETEDECEIKLRDILKNCSEIYNHCINLQLTEFDEFQAHGLLNKGQEFEKFDFATKLDHERKRFKELVTLFNDREQIRKEKRLEKKAIKKAEKDLKKEKNVITNEINYDLITIIECIDNIGITKFVDKFGDMKEMISILRKVIGDKIKNYNLSDTNNLRNKIPPSYLDIGIVEGYVKELFRTTALQSNYNPCEMIGSQVVQQTLKKLDKAYKGFFELKKGGFKANVPSYLKENKFNLIFQKNSFNVKMSEHGAYVNLSLGKIMKTRIEGGFLTFKIPKNLEYLCYNEELGIDEIELVPHDVKSLIGIIFKYKKEIPQQLEINGLNMASIDLGLKNLVTMFSPVFETPLIYKGGYLIFLNKKIKRLIKKYQSDLRKINGEHNSNFIKLLRQKRENIINDHFNKISLDIINRCVENNINHLMIGYNKNWKTNVNMGKKNNEMFYTIPYRKLIQKLFYKGAEKGLLVTEHNEAYTSKCDSINLEEIKFQEKYNGKRKYRGLFQSGNKEGTGKHVLINADVNGAVNIMRKGLYGNEKLKEELEMYLSTCNLKKICNPMMMRIGCQQKQIKLTGDVVKDQF